VLRRLGLGAGADAPAPAPAATFVGRAPELAALDAAYADVAAGRTVTVLVEGESGVGKSALVRELAARVAGPSTLVLRGRCYERESVPYKGVDALIDELAHYLASLREDEAAALLPDRAPLLRTLFPVLDAVPAVRDARATRSEVRNPQEARAQMFALLRSLLVNVALYRRLVLVVDDLQWADADSLALLADVLRPPHAPPLLLLASIRSATTRAAPGKSVQDRLADFPGDVRWIHHEPLGAESARDLARALLARASGSVPAAAEVEAIAAEAKGHPLFLDELVRHRAMRDAEAPMRLDDALVARAARLAPAARKVLELVAVAGVPVTQQVAGAAAEREQPHAWL
jgi:predicted ATPase